MRVYVHCMSKCCVSTNYDLVRASRVQHVFAELLTLWMRVHVHCA
jgi:hypothetical protein